MLHQGNLGLATIGTLGTLERCHTWQGRGNLGMEVLRAVVIVQRPGILEHLVANLTIMVFCARHLPAIAQFSLHESEHHLVTQSKMPRQLVDILAHKGTLGTLERLLPWQLLHDFLPEVKQQVAALVPGFVHRVLELFTAQFARGVR